jgi:hypothetical protein
MIGADRDTHRCELYYAWYGSMFWVLGSGVRVHRTLNQNHRTLEPQNLRTQTTTT